MCPSWLCDDKLTLTLDSLQSGPSDVRRLDLGEAQWAVGPPFDDRLRVLLRKYRSSLVSLRVSVRALVSGWGRVLAVVRLGFRICPSAGLAVLYPSSSKPDSGATVSRLAAGGTLRVAPRHPGQTEAGALRQRAGRGGRPAAAVAAEPRLRRGALRPRRERLLPERAGPRRGPLPQATRCGGAPHRRVGVRAPAAAVSTLDRLALAPGR